MKKGIFILALIISLCSCAPVYVPNNINTPLLTQKGELNINVNSGITAFDPQLSYAITDEFSVMMNGSYTNVQDDDSSAKHPRHIVDLAMGYNKPIGENWIFESYGGYSFGQTYGTFFNPDNEFENEFNANFQRFFVQPAFGFRSSVFDLVLVNRLSMHKITTNEHVYYDVFTEPALNAKLGYQAVKFTCELGVPVPLTKHVHYAWFPAIFHIGLQIKLFKDYGKQN